MTSPSDKQGYLVLRRRVGEAILIGDDIRIAVSEFGPDNVALAIKAPPEVQIDREEVREAKNRKENGS